LPPIASEVFSEKVLAAQASSTAAATKASYERSCEVCQKTYFSENAYQNHIGSQKHKAKVAVASHASTRGIDDASSVMSSTFSLGDPAASQANDDSDDEDDVSAVAAGVKQTTLKDDEAEDASKTPIAASEAASEASAATTIPLNRCLFCNYDSPTMPLNVVHMERIHGMFIPERQYLVDLEGLIGSLYQRIYEYHECLYCAKLKPTVFGLQTHMRDKGHCKIAFDTEDQQLEIGEFYDFRSTYSDDEYDSEDEEESKPEAGGVKLGLKRPTMIITEDGDEEMEDGDGWETDSSASSLDSEDLTAVPLDQRTHQYEKLNRHPHHSRDDPRPHRNADGWHSHAHKHAHAVFHSDYELHLPSGRAVGHRSLAKYYRQNLRDHPSPAELQEKERLRIESGRHLSDDEDERTVSRRERGRGAVTRANGGTGMLGVSESKKKEVVAEEKRSRKTAERERRRYEWGNNKQNNSQKHWRVSFAPSRDLIDTSLTIDRITCCSEHRLLWTVFVGVTGCIRFGATLEKLSRTFLVGFELCVESMLLCSMKRSFCIVARSEVTI
jgi:pre-60S factor REI1